MQSSLHLKFFAAALALGGLLAAFPGAQMALLVALLGLAALPPLLFLAYVLESRGSGRGLGPAWWLAVGAALALALLLWWPELDLRLARALYTPGKGFVARTALGEFGRFLGYMAPFVVLAAFAYAYVANLRGWRAPFAVSRRDFAFLALSMALGPGLIVNLAMKDHLHRPRPSQVAEFGGAREYRPFWRFDGSCERNCSFPSGEASEAFWMLAPASLAPPPWRGPAIAGAAVFGVLVSLLRMAFGGHFLSDVTIAALIMWALLLGLHRWIYRGISHR